MPATPTCNAHPRLYIGEPELARLKETASSPLLSAMAQRVADDADQFAPSPEFKFDDHTHNSLVLRARLMQKRIVTLLVRWRQTNDTRYRDATMEHVRQMDRWRHWSWIARRRGLDAPDAIFDLSYGENSATLATAYTLLHHTLSDEEASTFHDIAARRSLQSFLVQTGGEKKPHWFGKPGSNWNTVCAGGAGMLALAMYEDLPEAEQVLERSETSIEPYMRSLAATHGAWPEGIGYWNYGMRYAFMYLLSHERATGRPHPLMEQPATMATLHFPLDFCPNNVPCSFGDVNHWEPLPFHYAAAARFEDAELLAMLDDAHAPDKRVERPGKRETWPDEAELLLLHPRHESAAQPEPQRHIFKHYPEQDWCALADRWPHPRLYASIRGGTTNIPHSHRDLLSFNLVVNDEKLIQNAQNAEYLDTTFGRRRQELIEINPQGKSTLLLNGVGITHESAVQTDTFQADRVNAVRLDATEAMGAQQSAGTLQPAARGCYRLFAMLDDDVLLVVDRIEPTFEGRAEARFHTAGRVSVDAPDQAIIEGERQRIHAGFACDVPAALHTAELPLTSPSRSPKLTMLRWCTDDLHTPITMAAAFCAEQSPHLQLHINNTQIELIIEHAGRRRALRTTTTLNDPIVHE